ncbi:hypothetical protein A2V49_02315 [candidate division WWE3 bacterium RBG_19FT_COMBO_34_6]|uniref:Acyltransferase 3 domain-containing protein n=1 Tax=candidate division WWE3 bacterium RBG_19FT_COMBO_34_6 TaxID=1802612 RepID=A0A1F4UJH1_UNCKA|nr:MAG: hypothetical protein A2V49_02315 [candidate division WWE3 bacterium RBG_19FT_COMBO_34_6]
MINKRYEIIDLLRASSIIGVLLIHLSGWYGLVGGQPTGFYIILANISRFSVPMFVFISAALFYLKYDYKKFNLRSYYLNRIDKILLPYFLSSFIYYLYRLSNFVSSKQLITLKGVENIFDFITKTLTIGVFSHFYFIPLILSFYLIAPFLYKVFRSKSILFVIITVITNILFVFLMISLNIKRIDYRWTVFPYLIYITLGFFYAKNYEKLLMVKSKFLIALLVVLLLGIYPIYINYYNAKLSTMLYLSYVYDSLCGLVVIIFSYLLNSYVINNRIIKFLSNNSFSIYLWHYLFIDLIFSFIKRGKLIFELNFINYISLLVLIIVLSTVPNLVLTNFSQLLKYFFKNKI